MSRIGKKPIPVPEGITLAINGSHVKVTGNTGSLERNICPELELLREDDKILVNCKDKSKRTVALSGLTRTLLSNMIEGVHKGFQKKLIIEGVGYRVEVAGKLLTLHVGYSNPVKFDLPDGVQATVDKTSISLGAIDKELLGLTAARIRAVRPPEPYKGKGIRYEHEHIVRKAGKTAA